MTADEKSFISEQFDHLHEKLDLKINPICEKVGKLEVTQEIHTEKIDTLLLFKEGHQQTHAMEAKQHAEEKSGRRFMWEQLAGLIAGSGVIGLILTKWGNL